LASRLRLALDVHGSPEYALTWKTWDMPSGPPICALRASGRRTSDSGYSGWPTPDTPNGGRGISHATQHGATFYDKRGKKVQLSLENAAKLSGWATPSARDWKNGQASPETMARNARPLNEQAVMLAGWPTPKAQRPEQATTFTRGNPTLGMAAGWATPRAEDSEQTGAHRGTPDTLTSQGRLAGWATPTALERSGQGDRNVSLMQQARRGQMPSGSPASTAKPGALNPAFVRWLMGLPSRWDQAAPLKAKAELGCSKHTGTRSSRRSR